MICFKLKNFSSVNKKNMSRLDYFKKEKGKIVKNLKSHIKIIIIKMNNWLNLLCKNQFMSA